MQSTQNHDRERYSERRLSSIDSSLGKVKWKVVTLDVTLALDDSKLLKLHKNINNV